MKVTVPVLVLLVVATTLLVLRSQRDDGSVDPHAADFVQRRGTELVVDGQPFAFVGFNLYDAAATTTYKCASWPRWTDAQLNRALSYMHRQAGAKVLRFWAYQTYTAGGTDWSGVDRVIRLARHNGMRVLPVLEDGPGNCTTGPNNESKESVDGDTWYTQGYKKPYGTATLSYRDYVAKIVTHYRNDPTILGWSMMNEAETKQRASDGSSALVGFGRDIGSLIKSIDPRHLVTVGTQSNGAPGGSGRDFADIYSLPEVDFAEVHDWAFYGSDTDPMPGSVDGQIPAASSSMCAGRDGTKIACSFAIAAQELHKPLVVGEAGIAVQNGNLGQRSSLLMAKVKAALTLGKASGYLVWQFNKVEDGEGYDVLQNTHDPLVAQLKAEAQGLP